MRRHIISSPAISWTSLTSIKILGGYIFPCLLVAATSFSVVNAEVIDNMMPSHAPLHHHGARGGRLSDRSSDNEKLADWIDSVGYQSEKYRD